MGNEDEVQRPESLPALRAELRERSKELGYLHQATRLIHTRGEPRDLLRAVLELLPSAMCYPELVGARLCLGSLEMRTRGYVQMEPSLRATFRVEGEGDGFVEVCYTQPPPSAPAFLEEELSLLGSLAELLRGHFELMHAETAYRELMQADAAQQPALAEHRAQDPQLSRVAHELRSSWHGMLAWIQLLKQGSLDANLTAQGLQILEQNITHQAKLVEELLELSSATQAKGTRPPR